MQDLPARLTIKVGDVLQLKASGARVSGPTSTAEIVRFYISSLLSDHGQVLTPASAPNTVLIVGRRRGKAMLDIMAGHPFHNGTTRRLEIDVEE